MYIYVYIYLYMYVCVCIVPSQWASPRFPSRSCNLDRLNDHAPTPQRAASVAGREIAANR